MIRQMNWQRRQFLIDAENHVHLTNGVIDVRINVLNINMEEEDEFINKCIRIDIQPAGY